ncbi:hypothetical protein ACF0H5_003713 [Mactra antiquata]
MNFYMFVTIMITNAFQAYVIVPLIHPLKLTSTYEYLGRRFDSRSVQLLGTTMGMLQAMLYMCIVLLAPALALESEKCDPWANGNIDNPNQIVPYLVMRVFKYVPGLSGVFIAALFSGALSSLSSGINSLAANTIQDVLVNKLKESTEMRKTLVAKIVVLVYGILAIAGAYFAKGISGPVTQITWAISGGVGGPMVGILFLGAIFPQANWIGAMSGGIVGIVINLWIAVGSLVYGKKAPLSERIPTSGCTVPSELNLNFTTSTSSPGVMYTVTNATQNVVLDSPEGHIPLYDISYIYLGLIGLIVSMLIGLIVSLITGRRREDKVAARYILPFMRRLWNLEDNRASLNGDFHPVETNLW